MTVPGTHAGNYLGAGYANQYNQLSQSSTYAQAQMNAMQNATIYGTGTVRGAISPPHDPTVLKPEGMIAGEIIAWRAWIIRNGQLYSVVAEDKSWDAAKEMEGDPAAGYGVHAYKDPHGPLLDSYVSPTSPSPWVIGEVALWGDVIEHTDGYRAQFARVHSLVTWSALVTKSERDDLTRKYLTDRSLFKIDDAA